MSDLILSFEFYIAVRCGFDKHLYLTRPRKLALFNISQDRQTQVLAAIAMATTIIID